MEFGNIPSASEEVNHIAYYYQVEVTDENVDFTLETQNEAAIRSLENATETLGNLESTRTNIISNALKSSIPKVKHTKPRLGATVQPTQPPLPAKVDKGKEEEESESQEVDTYEDRVSKFWLGVLQRMDYSHPPLRVMIFRILDRLNAKHLDQVFKDIEPLRLYIQEYKEHKSSSRRPFASTHSNNNQETKSPETVDSSLGELLISSAPGSVRAPPEVLLKILNYLSVEDIVSLLEINKAWRTAIQSLMNGTSNEEKFILLKLCDAKLTSKKFNEIRKQLNKLLSYKVLAKIVKNKNDEKLNTDSLWKTLLGLYYFQEDMPVQEREKQFLEEMIPEVFSAFKKEEQPINDVLVMVQCFVSQWYYEWLELPTDARKLLERSCNRKINLQSNEFNPKSSKWVNTAPLRLTRDFFEQLDDEQQLDDIFVYLNFIEYLFTSNAFQQWMRYLHNEYRDGYRSSAEVAQITSQIFRVAAKIGNQQVIQFLLELDPSVLNSENGQDNTAFVYAAQNNHLDIAEALLNHPKFDPECHDQAKKALMYALNNRYHRIIHHLLKNEFFIDLAFLFFRQSHQKILSEYLEGYDINKYFIRCVKSRRSQRLRSLLREVEEINPNSVDEEGVPALIYASIEGLLEIIRILLDHPATNLNISIDGRRRGSLTALTEANGDKKDHKKIVEALLNHPRIDLNAADFQGAKAIVKAIDQKWKNIRDLILEKDIKVGYEAIMDYDLTGKNVDMYLKSLLKNEEFSRKILQLTIDDCIRGQSDDPSNFIRYLLTSERITELIDPNYQDEEGRTPLIYAAQLGVQFVVKLLLQHPRIELDENDQGVETLIKAIDEKWEDIRDLILKENPGLGLQAIKKRNYSEIDLKFLLRNKEFSKKVLRLAIDDYIEHRRDEELNFIKHLLTSERIDPNYQDEEGRTVLMYAVQKGLREIVRLLLNYGNTKLNLRDNNDMTALDYAICRAVKKKLIESSIIRNILSNKKLTHKTIEDAKAHANSLWKKELEVELRKRLDSRKN